MTLAKIKQTPLRLGNAQKSDVRTQFGALCWRVRKDRVQVLLVTSRRSGRWIIPKGWPMEGATPAEAAAREAWEEAGVEGKVVNLCLGIYSYLKVVNHEDTLPCVVAVFPMRVKTEAHEWPEQAERRRKWVSLKKAAAMVDAPELARLLREFDPSLLMR